MSDSDEQYAEMVVDELLEADKQAGIADYINRGRRLSGADSATLLSQWVGAVREVVQQRTPTAFRDLEDLNSELALRDIEPDHELVAEIMEPVRAEIVERGHSDPGLQNKIEEHIKKRESKSS